MLRLIVAVCYGAALLVTVLTIIGLPMISQGRLAVLQGWAFTVGLLFAVGRLADLARRDQSDKD